jgi:chemotaxis response regulator CheB
MSRLQCAPDSHSFGTASTMRSCAPCRCGGGGIAGRLPQRQRDENGHTVSRRSPPPKAANPTASPPPATARTRRRPQATAFPIIGLGASAGGLKAFEQFLKRLATDSGMGFVFVQHLDRSHPSILTEILLLSIGEVDAGLAA